MIRACVVLELAVCAIVVGACDEETSTSSRASKSSQTLSSDDWASWRGPEQSGVAPSGTPPLRWSEERNIAWKTPIPGRGHATPIVVGERIYLTTAIPTGDAVEPAPFNVPPEHDNIGVTHRHRFVVLALDRRDGAVAWLTTVREAMPLEGGHQSASLASGSPVSDGERIYAFFGSHGLHALDFDGKVLWSADFGQMNTKHAHGEGASPLVADGRVFVVWDHEGTSFLVAIDAKSGAELWRVERDEVTSWSSPISVVVDQKTQIIVNGTGRIRGYDARDGGVIWECGGLSHNVVASPVSADGIVVSGSSYEKKAMIAIRLPGAAGDLTETKHVVWTRQRGTPYVPSPLLLDGTVYFLAHYQNVLSGADLLTGAEQLGPIRLVGLQNIYASPVAANGVIYVTDQAGTTMVIRPGPKPEIIATNSIDDDVSASVAIAGSDLYLRGHHFLYSVREPQGP